MTAGSYNITAEQGAVFRRVIQYENPDESAIDLTGYTARMQVRKQVHSATPILELTTENGSIAIVGATGTITLYVSAETMAAAQSGKYVFDLEIIPPSGETDVIRLIEGDFLIRGEVTKP